MEKVTLYVKKILALLFSFSLLIALRFGVFEISSHAFILLYPGSFLLFAFLNYKITDEKPKFLFGLTQSDAFLTKKGGFWNLFKWIVNSLGFLYDIVVWIIWGVYLLFLLIVDFILLIKFVVYWIIHAIIWFIRQFFPPFIFLFKMFVHYIINWAWWIYQMTFRNVKISVNKNFYLIALWGTVPAIFIVFLFYAVGQLVGIEELVMVSAIFALIPLVWSYGEIAALRFEQREKEDYGSVKASFRNGWDSVKSVLFYLIAIIVLLIAEIVLNLMGWIPNLSMSLIGITINLNMFISFILVFLAVIITFADCIIPSHILYHPEHENDFDSSIGLLKVIGQKFVRYIAVQFPANFFGALLLIIPVFLMLLTFTITENIKDGVLDVKIENMKAKSKSMEALDEYRNQYKISRLELYKEVPEQASSYFSESRNSGETIDALKEELISSEELLLTKQSQFDKDLKDINATIEVAKTEVSDPGSNQLSVLTSDRLALEEEYFAWDKNQKECIAFLQADLKEQRSVRIQMPILYLFVGIFFSIFGGIVLAVFVAYIGNVYFELYNMREDEKPTYWRQTIEELKAKDGNQPLLGFTFLVIIIVAWLIFSGTINIVL